MRTAWERLKNELVTHAELATEELEAVLQGARAKLQQTKQEGEGADAEIKAELQVAKAELQLHKARSECDTEVLKAELNEAKHVATLLEGQASEEVKKMAKAGAAFGSARERRKSLQAQSRQTELESLSGNEGVQSKTRRAFLKARATRRMSTVAVTQGDEVHAALAAHNASLGTHAEIDEPEPEPELEPEPEPEPQLAAER